MKICNKYKISSFLEVSRYINLFNKFYSDFPVMGYKNVYLKLMAHKL